MDYSSLMTAVISWHRNTLYHTDACAYQTMLFPCPPCLIKFHRLTNGGIRQFPYTFEF